MSTNSDIKLPGLFVPPLTPFTQDGEVDYEKLRVSVDYVVEKCDPAAVVIAGVETQEYQYLELDKRMELIRSTVELIEGRKPFVVGISHPNPDIALKLHDFAVGLGATAVQLLISTRPSGGATTLSEVLRYFEYILQRVAVPVVAYHNPGGGTGFEPGNQGMIEIAKLDKVQFIKDSSRDMTRIGYLISEIDSKGYAKYLVTMQVLLPGLLLGAVGGTVPPPAARVASFIIKSFVRKDYETAFALQRIFSLFPGKWINYGLPAVMKEAFRAEGIDLGDPYRFVPALSAQDAKALKEYWIEHGIGSFERLATVP
jgi:4-hydroxy-tetrahydrodipicolinate synthase